MPDANPASSWVTLCPIGHASLTRKLRLHDLQPNLSKPKSFPRTAIANHIYV
ncbi:MAG: hypothetical protein AAFS12_15525 [Cyanobacteria bacterium J06632_19]